MRSSAEEFYTGGRRLIASNVTVIGFATVGAGINTRIGWGLPLWVALAFGLPGAIIFLYGIYLGRRARKMRVVLDDHGLRWSDWLGRTERVTWSEVEGLQLRSRPIPFSSKAVDLSWRDIRGTRRTRSVGSFSPPHGQDLIDDVRELIEAIEERLAMERENPDTSRGGSGTIARWEARDAASA